MIKEINYNCVGVCAKNLNIKYDDETNKIVDFSIVGGCNGNLKGIKALIIGCDMKEIHDKLKGITCGPRPTSCPDQIACALETVLNK